MTPAYPPFPSPWNLPFQPAAGIHTSNRISESGAGLMAPATRQNAGRLLNFFAPAGVKSPAGTLSAVVMVVAGSETLLSAAQLSVARASGAQAVRANAPIIVWSLGVMGSISISPPKSGAATQLLPYRYRCGFDLHLLRSIRVRSWPNCSRPIFVARFGAQD